MKSRAIFMVLLPFAMCDLRKPPSRPPLLRSSIGTTKPAPAAIEPHKDATTKAYVAATTQLPAVTASALSSSVAAPAPFATENASISIEPKKEDDSYEQGSKAETPSQPQAPSQPESPSQPEAQSHPEAPSQAEESSQPEGSSQSEAELAAQYEAELAAQYEAEALKDGQSGPKYKLVPQVIFKKVFDDESVPVKSPPPTSTTRPPLPRPQPAPKPVFTRRPPAATPYPITTSTQRVTTKAPPPPPPTRAPPTQKPVFAPVPLKTNFACKDGNGYYAVDNECDSYIECKYDQAKKYWCPDGLHFNPNAKRYEYPCAYPSAVKCNAGTQQQNSKPTAQCPRQYGFFPMRDGDCSKYVVCQEGAATIMPCPVGLAFNPSTENCDYVQNVPQCNPIVFKDYKCPEPPLDEDGFVSDVVYKYKYENQCKYYIACQRGYPRLLSCEYGLAFDDQWQACIDEDYVQDCATQYLPFA